MHKIFRLILVLLLCASPSLQAGSIKAAAKPELAGHYYLQGATEVGSELVLRNSGKFGWALMYGNQDFTAEGLWQEKGGRVVLSTGVPAAMTFRLFDESELRIRKPPKAGTWVAIVGVPMEGPVADVEVRFESASGKVATAVSDQNGDAIVTMPANEHWTRSGFRRAGTQDPWQWLSLPTVRAKNRIAGFAITNPQSIRPAPFKTLSLRSEKHGLVIDDDQVGFRGVYVKQPE